MLKKIAYLFIFSFSCNQNYDDQEDAYSQSEYFPVKKGNYWVYESERISINLSENDTSQFFIKAEVIDSSVLKDGSIQYVMEYSSSGNLGNSWNQDSVVAFQISSSAIKRFTNGQYLVHLTFPISRNQTWNAGAFSSDTLYYSSQILFKDTTWQSMVFEDLVLLTIIDIPENIVNQNEQFEWYAREIGCIYRSITLMQFEQFCCVSTGDEEDCTQDFVSCNPDQVKKFIDRAMIQTDRLIEFSLL